jgi:hypothetical protein
MPQQLIYTSAPQGLAAGRSGHCTVARSASIREPLVLRLEQLSYYQHLSLSGGKERPILAYRFVDIRGARFHVLSRIQDAGLDFTGRTNFIAHHLVLTAEDFRQFSTPPIILRDWPGWLKSWTREPTMLENEDWASLASLAAKSSVPTQAWQRVTGDAVNGYGLLEARAGATFRVDDQTNETVLGLFAESIELLEVRDPRRDFRAAALQYTFTTSMQEQDNPSDFRWRCIHSDNPAANRLATPDCRPLSAVRATKLTAEEAAFARTGRQAPIIVVEPQDVQITEGGAARFQAKAEGIPNPCYQWFKVDQSDNGQPLDGETNLELVLSTPPFGKSRYVVRVNNSVGEAISRTAVLSVEQKPRLAQVSLASPVRPLVSGHQKSQSDIDRQRKQLDAERAERQFQHQVLRTKVLVIVAAVIAVACIIFLTPIGRPALTKLIASHIEIPSTSFSSQFISRLVEHSDQASTVLWTNLSEEGQSLLRNYQQTSADQRQIQKVVVQALNRIRDQPIYYQSLTLENTNSPGSSWKPSITSANKDDSSSNAQRETAAANRHAGEETEWRLPPGWTNAPIGNVSNKKAEYFPSYNRFDLEAMASGFASNSDNVLFTYSTNDEVELRVQLKKWPAEDNTVGIMIRQSLDSNSPFLFIGASSNRIISYSRNVDGKFRDRSTNSTAEHQLPLSLWFDVGANDYVSARWQTADAQLGWNLRFSGKLLMGFAVFSASTNRETVQFFYAPTTNRAVATKTK